MKIQLNLIVLAIALPIVLAACNNKENPFNKMISRYSNAQDTIIEAPPKDEQKDEPEQKSEQKLKEEIVNEKKLSDVPPPPPVVALPIPPPPDDDFVPPPVFLAFTACGNNIVTQDVLEGGIIRGEECEDGNASNGDGCSSTCRKEYCGNGLVERGEQCDPGRDPELPYVWNQATPTLICDRFCDFIICGDGIVNGHEECDDCNQLNCDGCSSTCKLENLKEECNFTCSPSSPFTCPIRAPIVCRPTANPTLLN